MPARSRAAYTTIQTVLNRAAEAGVLSQSEAEVVEGELRAVLSRPRIPLGLVLTDLPAQERKRVID